MSEMRTRNIHIPDGVSSDIEGGSKNVPMPGAPGRPIIQPFEGFDPAAKSKKSRRGSSFSDMQLAQQVCIGVAGVWLVGWLILGWGVDWPFHMVLEMLRGILSIPPLSWFHGWFHRGAPLVNHGQPLEEATLPQGQVAQYIDSYVQQYGDAALIFAAHDGYPQIVKNLLLQDDLGYRDLIDARDDTGNTALIYSAAKGFRACTAALLRAGADPEVVNQGAGGRTALMEAAGGGHRDIVQALRMMPNISIDLADDHGNSALHYAAYHGHLSVVMDLLKSNPNKEAKNEHGQTAASYAASNGHKGIADVLNRASRRSAKEGEQKEEEEEQKDSADAIADQLKEKKEQSGGKIQKREEPKQTKGKAEDLQSNEKDSAPPESKQAEKVSDTGKKALEDQLARLRRQHEEAELKSQKRIVELLEKTTAQQKALDESQEKHREYELNHTQLQLQVQELETKHRSSELKAQEEATRAKGLEEKHREAQLELDRHKQRADETAELREKLRRAEEELSRLRGSESGQPASSAPAAAGDSAQQRPNDAPPAQSGSEPAVKEAPASHSAATHDKASEPAAVEQGQDTPATAESKA
eukprot:TRINITY_DN8099_c0_g1_i1.p1 TRINITY_DN8099_c0_g1~~TRINITY_DN8099_c0_g1_i1.p1  ORF type:complete len:584 (+),score=161.70 TRINITY_DN8099_c0_g1_i1:103-1854(+)